MNRLSATIFLSLAAYVCAGAVTVNINEAGTLGTLVDNPATVTELKLTGQADATDFNFIATSMPTLTALNLADVTIVASEGTKINGVSHFAANLIPEGAFAGMAIKEVTLPATPGLNIGDMAFEGTALTSLTLPDNVNTAGTGAFAGCQNLRSITLNEKTALGSHLFSNCQTLAAAYLGSTATLPASAFDGCAALETVEGAEALMAIEANAFSGCRKLTDFEFGEKLTAIGAEAFANTGLTTADLGMCRQLTTIGDYAFIDCREITTVNLGPAITTLGTGCFLGCENLASITLPAACETVGDYAMARCLALSEVEASDLAGVPQTGRDVWRGVDQPNAKLNVSDDTFHDFAAAPQWQEFEITSPTYTNAVDLPVTDTTRRLEAHFNGNTLTVVSCLNRRVSLYDLNGRCLASTATDGAECRLTFDTEGRDGNIFIVVADGLDGVREALKIIRK